MNNRAELVESARKLVAKARTDEAMELLATYVASEKEDPAAQSWRNAIVSLQSRWETLRYREIQQLSSQEQLGRQRSELVYATLALIQQIEEGRTAPAHETFVREKAVQTHRWLRWAMLGTLLIAVAVGLFWWANRDVPPPVSEDSDPPMQPTGLSCPDFSTQSAFNILVLPFRPYRGDPSSAHLAIGDRLAQEAERYGLRASVRPVDQPVTEIDPYPVGASEARRTANNCAAQLIIWGNTEPLPAGLEAGEVIRIDFAFAESDNFDFAVLELDETARVETVTTLSSIVSSGRLTESIEYNIRLLLGLVARESEQYAETIEILEKLPVDSTDPTASMLHRMILADTYLEQENYDRAKSAYAEVVAVNPDYSVARSNLALLYYREEAYESAAKQLDTLALLQPTDKTIARRQVLANIKAGQLYKVSPLLAATPNKRAAEKPIREEDLPQIRQEYQAKARELETEQRAADRVLRRDPDNVEALETKARTARNLGNFTESRQTLDRIQLIDPDNRLVPQLRDTVRLQLPVRNIRLAPPVDLRGGR